MNIKMAFLAFLLVPSLAYCFWGPKLPDGYYREASSGLGTYNFRKDGAVFYTPSNKPNPIYVTFSWRTQKVTDAIRATLPKNIKADDLIIVEAGTYRNNTSKHTQAVLCFVGDDLLDLLTNMRYNRLAVNAVQ